jgi:AcrR family transcriptional regulator
MTQARALKKRGTARKPAAQARSLSDRTAQTRQLLLDAATALFAERGYHETGVPDIVRAAGVSQGTFYQYFTHRREILVELAKQAHATAQTRPPLRSTDFEELLRAQINWYLIESISYTTLAKVWHDAAVFDQELAALTHKTRVARAKQFSAVIRQLKGAPGLDPDITASALLAMIEEFTYRWIVQSDGPRTTSEAIKAGHTLSELVMRALGIKPRGEEKQPGSRA